MKFFDLLSKIKSSFNTSNIKVVMDRKRPHQFFGGRGLLVMFWDGEKHIKNSEMGSSKKTHFAHLEVVRPKTARVCRVVSHPIFQILSIFLSSTALS